MADENSTISNDYDYERPKKMSGEIFIDKVESRISLYDSHLEKFYLYLGIVLIVAGLVLLGFTTGGIFPAAAALGYGLAAGLSVLGGLLAVFHKRISGFISRIFNKNKGGNEKTPPLHNYAQVYPLPVYPLPVYPLQGGLQGGMYPPQQQQGYPPLQAHDKLAPIEPESRTLRENFPRGIAIKNNSGIRNIIRDLMASLEEITSLVKSELWQLNANCSYEVYWHYNQLTLTTLKKVGQPSNKEVIAEIKKDLLKAYIKTIEHIFKKNAGKTQTAQSWMIENLEFTVKNMHKSEEAREELRIQLDSILVLETRTYDGIKGLSSEILPQLHLDNESIKQSLGSEDVRGIRDSFLVSVYYDESRIFDYNRAIVEPESLHDVIKEYFSKIDAIRTDIATHISSHREERSSDMQVEQLWDKFSKEVNGFNTALKAYKQAINGANTFSDQVKNNINQIVGCYFEAEVGHAVMISAIKKIVTDDTKKEALDMLITALSSNKSIKNLNEGLGTEVDAHDIEHVADQLVTMVEYNSLLERHEIFKTFSEDGDICPDTFDECPEKYGYQCDIDGGWIIEYILELIMTPNKTYSAAEAKEILNQHMKMVHMFDNSAQEDQDNIHDIIKEAENVAAELIDQAVLIRDKYIIPEETQNQITVEKGLNDRRMDIQNLMLGLGLGNKNKCPSDLNYGPSGQISKLIDEFRLAVVDKMEPLYQYETKSQKRARDEQSTAAIGRIR